MATRATETLRQLAAEWKKLHPSAAISGIVGDTRHAKRGGYHISIEDQVNRSDYSVVRPDDKAPPGAWPRDAAAAIDMNLNLGDMKVCHGRLCAVWRNRASDPRARYINAHNGWDGNGSPGRYDWVTGSVSTATDDHKWHVHMEIRRRYVNDPKAAQAVLSILRGESLADYLGDDDMTPEQSKQLAEVHELLTRWGVGLPTMADGKRGIEPVKWRQRDEAFQASVAANLSALAGRDWVDEPAIIQGVLAGLTPERIAAAIPPTVARQVVDELNRRLAS